MTFPIAARSAVAYCALVVGFAFAATPIFAITIDGESRLTEEQFAKKNARPISEVKKTFAASGTLECWNGRKGGRLTAQLTGKNDIIVTAAHGFADPKTCERRMRPEQCTFRAHDGQRMHARSVQLLAKGDWRCDQTDSKNVSLRGSADWAVLKLSAPITTIAPYELGMVRPAVANARTWSVSAHSKDFRLGGKPSPNVKTIDDCLLKRSFFLGQQWVTMLETNCDTAQGNSGGALLATPSVGAPQLLAITIGFMAKGDGKKSRNAPEDGPYRDAAWSSLAVALTGPFRTALEKALGVPPATASSGSPVLNVRSISVTPEEGSKPWHEREKAAFPPLPPPCEQGATTKDGLEVCRKP